jgi:hypothetical protein
MMENFFGKSFFFENEGNGQIRFGFPGEMRPEQVTAGPNIEQIDMGKTILVIIEDRSVTSPSVSVLDSVLIIRDEEGIEIARVKIDVAVSADESEASFRNGILEINLVKSDDQKTDSDTREYPIRVIL